MKRKWMEEYPVDPFGSVTRNTSFNGTYVDDDVQSQSKSLFLSHFESQFKKEANA